MVQGINTPLAVDPAWYSVFSIDEEKTPCEVNKHNFFIPGWNVGLGRSSQDMLHVFSHIKMYYY